jgi:archaellum biogenesis protein FlaJ (TadC family)
MVVVEAVADDLESYYNLRTDRKQRVRVYVVIMFMSFFISSGVLIALDVTFFGFISEQVASNESNARNSASYGQDLPIEFFRRVFIHTLFFLALVSGFVAGMMENGEIQNGFKYALAMVTLGLFAFGIAPFIL